MNVRSLLQTLILATALAGLPALAEPVAPDALARAVTQDVLHIIKTDPDIKAGDSQEINRLVEEKILPHFDFQRMTRLAVGKDWRRATPAQRQELVDQFRGLLVRTYSSSLAAYNDQKVTFRPVQMRPGDTDATVRTEVQHNGKPVPIDLEMQQTGDTWKVYDVAIDGISLVTTYRSSFANEIQRAGIDGLIETLRRKNQGAAAPQAARS